MKKLLIILISLSLIFAFAACGQTEESAEETPARMDSVISGMLSLNGMTEEEYEQWYAETIAASSEDPVTRPVFYDDMSTMLMALEKGDIDQIPTYTPTARYLQALYPDEYVLKDLELKQVLAMAVSADNTQLLEKLDSAIAALEADGTLAVLREQYIDQCDPAAMTAPAELPYFEGADPVRVVVTGDIPPMDYMTADGQAAGYNVALLAAIGEQAQINIQPVSANAGSRTLMITSGKADAIFWCCGQKLGEQVFYCDLAKGMATTRAYLEVTGSYVSLVK